MTANLHLPVLSKEILDQAAEWVLAIDAEPDWIYSSAFTQWLYEDRAHLYAFEQTAHTFEIAVELPHVSQKEHTDAIDTPSGAAQMPVAFKHWFAMAASIVVCVTLLLAFSMPLSHPAAPLSFSTQHGEVSEFSLPDHSLLHLDTDSAAEAQISDTSRKVRLIKGRLFADVAHDPRRQFSVAVDDATAFTALGTAYSVAKSEASWTLKVYEGVVGVASSLVSHRPVKAGWGLRYQHKKLEQFKLVDVLTPGMPDWQHMQVKFNDESLQNAIIKMNQYADKPIKISDPKLAAMTISGVFNLASPAQFSKSVSQLTGASVAETDTAIILSLDNTSL